MSTKPKHTAEPWKHVYGHDTHKVKRDKNGAMLGPVTMSLDDYDRAIACVNACAGAKDPEGLVEFAKAVLRQMESDPEWSSDTLDGIAAFAFDANLAVVGGDENGGFMINRKQVLP